MKLLSTTLRKLIAGVAVAVVGTMAAQAGCQPADIGRFLGASASPEEAYPTPSDVSAGPPAIDPRIPSQTVAYDQAAQSTSGSLVVGSFNIQAFGRSKISKPHIASILVDVARRFDILAIQELRDKEQQTVPAFLQMLNRDGYHYAAAVSRRVGYQEQGTGRKYEEQMVYLYDTRRVEIISRPYVAQDRYSIMHRPPYVAHFRCRGLPPGQAFSFVLMNVHTDPDDTEVEFEALQEIIGSTFPNHPGEDDFLLLGDLNDDADGFRHVRWFSDQFPVIPPHWKTNTRMSKSYDNIVLDARRTAEFQNQAGVMNLLHEYGLTKEQALQVSDHMPVWAVFSMRESAPTTVTRTPQVVR